MDTAVSLIVPIYNAETYLTACLESVAAQTLFPRTQVLLVDDGSTDASPQICDVYAQKYPNIEVLHRRNAGVSAARNAGLEQAVGKYVAFADADDLLWPQMLERLFDAAEDSCAQLCFCAFRCGTADGEQTKGYPFPGNEPFGRERLVRYMLSHEDANALWNKLFLRAPIVENNIRMTVGRRLGEDREFILRFLACCDTLCYVPQELYYYRYVETGAIRRPQKNYARALTTQFFSDRAQFAALGVRGDDFIQGGALCYCRRIASTIDLICRTFSGMARLDALRRFYADDRLQRILRAVLRAAKNDLNRYEHGLLRCMRLHLTIATRLWMRLLTIRTNAYQRSHEGGRA